MIMAILYNKSYKDIAVSTREEIINYFSHMPGKKNTPHRLVSDHKNFVDNFQMESRNTFDVFEVYIKGPQDKNAEYNEIWPKNYVTTVFSKRELNRLPKENEIIETLDTIPDFEKGLYIRRRVIVEGADIRDPSDPGVEHLV